jgi:hypothetical protein
VRPVRHQRDREREGSIGRGGVFGHDRPDTSGHEWLLTRTNRMLALCHSVSLSGASGQAS